MAILHEYITSLCIPLLQQIVFAREKHAYPVSAGGLQHELMSWVECEVLHTLLTNTTHTMVDSPGIESVIRTQQEGTGH